MQRLSQTERFAKLHTPLGQDVLVLVKLQGDERISTHFEWTIDCLLNADESPVDPAKIIGLACHVEMKTPSGDRYFHGLCTQIRFGGWRGGHMLYQLVLRPWTWLMTRESACEIFHNLSVDDIIKQVFNDRSFSDFKFQLRKSYSKIPYCVQYHETSFDFVSRLMEKFGLFYFFEFSDSKHNMVIVDDRSLLPDVTGYDALPFRPDTVSGAQEEVLFDWHAEDRLRTALVDVDDYNPDKPTQKLEKTGKAPDNPKHAHNQLKHYNYPTGYREPADGQLLADVLVEVERTDAARKYARGYAPLIHAGGAFKLEDHPVREENVKHIAIAVRHELFLNHTLIGDDGQPGSGMMYMDQSLEEHPGSSTDEDSYDGYFEVADAQLAYRAPKAASIPRIHGAQTAEVITEQDGEEIDVDKEGRILVRFHWNGKDEAVNKCSCRVRVAQIWAGSGWGGVWIPRVGMEVVVEFLNGDPDSPLVTGCVYNGSNKPPVSFPGDKTQSTIKSEISKGGGGFNEFRFEDKKGEEEIFVHGHRHLKTELIEGDETRDIQKGQRTTTIKKDDEKTIQDGNEITIISKGDQTTKISMGKGTTTAMKSFEIKVGSSSLKLEPAKITMKSVQILIDASGKLDTKAGAMATHQAGGIMTIKGALVKIN